MKKNKLLIFVNFSVILMLILNIFSCVFATSVIPTGTVKDKNGKDVLGENNNPIVKTTVGPDISPLGSEPKKIANTFIGFLKWIGYIIAIGMVIYIGIKYTMAAADEKANMKGVLVKVVIGALIIVFANVIVNILLSISTAQQALD